MTAGDPLIEIFDAGWPSADAFVAVTDPLTQQLPSAARFLAGAAATHVVVDRPTLLDAEAIAGLMTRTGSSTLIGIGSGVALDNAKLGAFNYDETGSVGELIAIPCGPEPYRAVTSFAMYDDRPGVRTSIQQPWFRASRVHLIDELLDEVPASTFALFAGDSLVHAIESLMSQASNPASEVHARRAANSFIEQAFAVTPDRKLLMEASMRAAVALEITKLGLAHALSRPMGIATGESHDMFNLMLGAPVMRYWGDDVIQRSALAKDVALDPVANLWIELLDHYQRSAGLPDTLAETSLTWEDVERAAETATQSTGIPLLPRPLDDGDLLRIATDAWSGASR